MAKGRRDKKKEVSIEDGFSVKLHESMMRPYRGEDQCCKCGARSKLTPVDGGVDCGVCGSVVKWV